MMDEEFEYLLSLGLPPELAAFLLLEGDVYGDDLDGFSGYDY